MKTTAFDAALDIPAKELVPARPVSLVVGGRLVRASAAVDKTARAEGCWARVAPDEPLDVRWGEGFEVLSGDGRALGRGRVLHPTAFDGEEVKPARRKDLLERLSQGEREMVLVLAETKGIRGLAGGDVAGFSGLERVRVEALARGLEAEGRVRILSFSPLFLVLQDSLDFLRRRVEAFLLQYLKRHPGQRGVPMLSLEKKFAVAPNVLQLALRALVKTGRVSLAGDTAMLVDFRAPLSAEDEKILAGLEAMFLKGDFGQVSIDDIRKKLRLTPPRLQRLLGVLMERKTIVEGPDGFLLHSKWLEDVVRKVRASGNRELTVADFKALTGLTRKYAIPLLELLDEMGVTRRKGATRDILK
jgi:selenocysteine-specific elongation factor